MDTMMGSLAIYSPIAIVVILLLYITLTMWRRALGYEGPLLLSQMLRRLGVSLPGVVTQGAGYDYAHAVRRCVSCGEAETCRKALETGKQESYAEFCPNAEFIQRLKKAA